MVTDINFRFAVLIIVLFSMLTVSGCVQQGRPPAGGDAYAGSPGQTANQSVTNASSGTEGRELNICDRACIDFCNAHPGTPGPKWEEITPPGSTKNCKTILEEDMGIPISTCKECKCMCFGRHEAS